MPSHHAIAILIGRILLSAIFLLSGAGKLMHFQDTATMMAGKGLPMPSLLLVGAIAFELIGSLMVAVGFRARVGATLLILFLIPVTLIFHAFWSASGEAVQQQTIEFMKNLAIIGGLLIVGAMGSGPVSVDSMRSRG